MLAPGFLFHRERVALPPAAAQPGAPWPVTLSQEGAGEIHLVGFPPEQRQRLYLQRDGLRWDLPTLLRWAQLHGASNRPAEVRLPRLPPGEYALCRLDGGDCDVQVLNAHSVLIFQGDQEPWDKQGEEP